MSRRLDWGKAKRRKLPPERKSKLEVRADRYLEAVDRRQAEQRKPKRKDQ